MRKALQTPAPVGDSARLREMADYDRRLGSCLMTGGWLITEAKETAGQIEYYPGYEGARDPGSSRPTRGPDP